MTDFRELIEQCDRDIRGGHPHDVAKRLSGLNSAKVPRQWRLPLATLCRRAGLYPLGISLLHKLVAPQGSRQRSEATHAELAEYSVLLLRLGAPTEALRKLRMVDVKAVPDALLYRAFCHFVRWEFSESIPLLEAYLTNPLSDYAALVGRVNLAYTLVECGKIEMALPLLEKNIQVCAENGYARLQSNCHALRAQLFIGQKNYSFARKDLDLAHELLGTGEAIDQFFIIKWRYILASLQNSDPGPVIKLKELAMENQEWEAAREADYYSLQSKFDKVQFLHLLFGTPSAGYRDRLCQNLANFPDRTVFVLGSKASPRLDLRTGEIDGRPVLNPGRKVHQLIEILLRDFYQPLRIGGLFFELFPNEHFNVDSSPDRVHQILRRTRRWIEQEEIPIEIREDRGFYSLSIVGPFSFRVPLERKSIECMNLYLEALRKELAAAGSFSARQVQKSLGLSRRTVQRILTWGLTNGKVAKLNANSATLYKLVA